MNRVNAESGVNNNEHPQGYILEASPLPKLPVIGLQPVLELKAAFHVSLDHQSREEEIVNGKNSNIEQQSTFPRYPLVLLVDGIVSSAFLLPTRLSMS